MVKLEHGMCNVVHELKPTLLMVFTQFALAVVNIFYKLAIQDGMNLRIVIAYRFVFATAFIAPLAFICERKTRPKMTWMVLFQAFLSGLFGGSLGQNLYLESLALTSATFAAAMTNLIPAITFILAVCFRLERLNIRAIEGKAKVAGTVIGVGGAMLLTFYKGVEINLGSFDFDLLHDKSNGHVASSHIIKSHPVLGALAAIASCVCYSFWLIIQAKMSKNYPSHYSSTALMSIMGAIQGIVFALCVERDWSEWKLGWNVRLLTVAYSGIVASGLMVTIISWCVRMRGPLFASVFNPLMLVLVALAGSLMLNEKLHLGSVLGAVLIVCGLYVVLWGKGKEMKKMTRLVPAAESSHEVDSHAERHEIVISNNEEIENGPHDQVDGHLHKKDKEIEEEIS